MTSLNGRTAAQARVVGSHERSDVQALRTALADDAIRKPSFNVRGVTEDQEAFARTSAAFEDLSVVAYAGQAPRIQVPAYRIRRHPRNQPARPHSRPHPHGCVRLRNADIIELDKLMPLGTPISIT